MKKILLGLLILIIITTAAVVIIKRQPNKKCDHCNIVMIDIDVLRADELPCYGYSRNTAPNICAFANESAVFKDNYSTSYWTLPSIFSTITSLYPTFHKVRTEYIDKLSPSIPTLAETLQKQGYKTIFVGYGINPALITKANGGLRGYDVITEDPIEKVISDMSKSSQPWFVHYYTGDLHLPYLLPENVKPIDGSLTPPKNLPITDADYQQLLNKYLKKHYAEVFNKKAIKEYGSIILGPDKEKDVSVSKIFSNVTWSNEVPDEYVYDKWKPLFNTYMESFDQNSDSDKAYLRMLYDTKIKEVDKELGPILQKIDSKDLSKKTITVISSDHGEAFGEHGTFSHDSNSYSELYYTPLIIKAPRLPARQVEQTTSNIDIFPTLLDLIGTKKLDSFQGKSLIPFTNNKNLSGKSFSLSEYSDGVILQNHNWLYFLPVWTDRFENSKLFDRISDPSEKNNVAKQNPELSNLLYKQADLLRTYNGLIYKPEEIPSDIKLDPEKIKRLKKEGYF